MNDKWKKWARGQREQYKKYLALAESGQFKISEVVRPGDFKDTTPDYIARLKATIASLDELISDDA